MAKCMIGIIAVALLICMSATPAAAHGFLAISTGDSLPAFGCLSDLSDSRSFFFSATFESGTGVEDSWDVLGGLRLYMNSADFRPYWGIYARSESQNDPIPYSRNGIEGVYGWEWRYGEVFQICAFAEAGMILGMENGSFVCVPVYGLGVGVSLWMY